MSEREIVMKAVDRECKFLVYKLSGVLDQLKKKFINPRARKKLLLKRDRLQDRLASLNAVSHWT